MKSDSGPPQQQIDDPTTAHVLAGLAAVIQNVGVGAAGFFEGVGQNGQAVEGAIVVDRLGQLKIVQTCQVSHIGFMDGAQRKGLGKRSRRREHWSLARPGANSHRLGCQTRYTSRLRRLRATSTSARAASRLRYFASRINRLASNINPEASSAAGRCAFRSCLSSIRPSAKRSLLSTACWQTRDLICRQIWRQHAQANRRNLRSLALPTKEIEHGIRICAI